MKKSTLIMIAIVYIASIVIISNTWKANPVLTS